MRGRGESGFYSRVEQGRGGGNQGVPASKARLGGGFLRWSVQSGLHGLPMGSFWPSGRVACPIVEPGAEPGRPSQDKAKGPVFRRALKAKTRP